MTKYIYIMYYIIYCSVITKTLKDFSNYTIISLLYQLI